MKEVWRSVLRELAPSSEKRICQFTLPFEIIQLNYFAVICTIMMFWSLVGSLSTVDCDDFKCIIAYSSKTRGKHYYGCCMSAWKVVVNVMKTYLLEAYLFFSYITFKLLLSSDETAYYSSTDLMLCSSLKEATFFLSSTDS